jgi:thioredoxin-like negative regulator of GroEL
MNQGGFRRRLPGGEPTVPDCLRERPWLRQMYGEPRWAAAVCLLALAALGAFAWWLPLWPHGSRPDGSIRWISGQHRWMSARWSAKALQAEQQQDWSRAATAWRAAAGHDPDCQSCERRQLQALLAEHPPERASLTNGTRHGLWLLHLSQTNRADLVLLARLLLHHGEAAEAVALLESEVTRFDAAQLPVYLEARLAERTFDRIGPLWPSLSQSVRQDPVVRCYELGWQMGWGPAADALRSRRELERMEKTGRWSGARARMEFEVALKEGSLTAVEQGWKRLQDAGLDRVGDGVRVAGRGRAQGQPERARAALFRVGRARSADEAMEWVRGAVGLAERRQVVDWLREAAPRLDRADLWMVWGDTLWDGGEWEAAWGLAQRLLQVGPRELEPYAHYFAGVAAERLGRPTEAQAAFLALERLAGGDPGIVWVVASKLVSAGHPREAQALLGWVESQWGQRREYWREVHRVALAAGDAEGQLQAARRAWQLAPDDPGRIEALVLELLRLRRDPAEAVRLTFELVSQDPGNERYRLHRALALIQNGRDDEGLALLEQVSPRDRALRTGIYLGRFEVHVRRREWDMAKADYRGLDTQELVAAQWRWIDQQYEFVVGQSRGDRATPAVRQP